MLNSGEKYGLSIEDLDKSERRVPIYSIYSTLTEEQLLKIENGDLIKTSLLTKEQLETVNDLLSFDYKYGRVGSDTSNKVYSYL